jgi:uncharacterized protein
MRTYTILSILTAACALALTATPAPAQLASQDPSVDEPRVLQVSARATVQRAPDRAVVELAVENQAETARQATALNARAMQRVLSALRGLGVPEARIQTTRIELQPRYDRPRDQPPSVVGYQAANQVVVRLDDIDLVGGVVDAAVEAGANRVTGIRFEISDPDAAYHEALRLAVQRARAEAETVAAALGEALGPALRVSTGGMQLPPPQVRMEMARVQMDMAEATPVRPGEMEVHATVNITYRIGS